MTYHRHCGHAAEKHDILAAHLSHTESTHVAELSKMGQEALANS